MESGDGGDDVLMGFLNEMNGWVDGWAAGTLDYRLVDEMRSGRVW